MAPRKAASGSVISRNWVKTSTFSCLAAISSASSRRRANLPLSSALQAAIAQPLRGVVADLLEAHQEGQHHALALDAVGVFQRFGQFLHRLLVQRGLRLAQAAAGLDLGLVRQVGDDPLVGLQPPQDVGPHQRAQRAEVLGLRPAA